MSRQIEERINKMKLDPNSAYTYDDTGQTFITGRTGKFEKFVTEEEYQDFKKAKEAKEIFEQAVKEDQKAVIKARIKRQRKEKELKESPEMQSEEFAKAKQEYQNAYVDLITAGDDNKRYDKTLEISDQPEFYKLFNAVVNAEKKLNKVTKKLSRLRDDSVYVDSLNIVRELVGDDINFSAQLPGKPSQPKEEPKKEPEERTPIDISARLQEAHSNYKSATGDKFDRMIDRQSDMPIDKNKEIIKTQPQTLPPVLQPKKSTQDADRKKKISDEELKRILGS
tara:strand:+ start:238 stop:1080 length:843 start_codon:yes stop_codon:yes gene_type:complete